MTCRHCHGPIKSLDETNAVWVHDNSTGFYAGSEMDHDAEPATLAPRTTFKVPAENIEALKGRIEKLNRRVALLAKRGYAVEPISIEVSDPVAVPQKCPHCDSPWRTESVCPKCHGRPLPDRVFHEVKLLAPKAPKVDGWEFVAALTHVEGVGAVLRVCPGAEVAEGELAKYRDASSENCDHCHTKRRRTDTFIIRKVG